MPEEMELKGLESAKLEDILKLHIYRCSLVSTQDPQKLPVAVAVFEKMLSSKLDGSYWEAVRKIEENANLLFPKWQRSDAEGMEQRMQRDIHIAIEKFGLLFQIFERILPKKVDLEF